MVKNTYAKRFTNKTTPYTELLRPPIRETMTVKIEITNNIMGKISSPNIRGKS